MEDRRCTDEQAQRTYKALYPYVNLGLDLSLLSCDIAYLFDKTDSYRPWHTWLGLRIERKGPDDIVSTSNYTKLTGQPTTNPSFLSKLPPLLPPLLLVLKLSQWWYSPSSPRSLPVPQTSTTNHNLIPPPRPLSVLPTADIYPPLPAEDDGQPYTIEKVDYGKCPLCRRKWQNPAILESGWVVCWRCGWDAIQGDEEYGDGKGICPITGVSVSRTDLRRVLL
jgi:peroxin-12